MDDLGKIFKSSIETDRGYPVPEGSWQKMRQALEQSRKRRRFLGFHWIHLLAFLSLSLMFSWEEPAISFFKIQIPPESVPSRENGLLPKETKSTSQTPIAGIEPGKAGIGQNQNPKSEKLAGSAYKTQKKTIAKAEIQASSPVVKERQLEKPPSP